MGFTNPDIPWRELERRLSGRPAADEGPVARKRPKYRPAAVPAPAGPRVPFAELHAHSSFSFLDGASLPEELVEEAVRLGLSGLALTDHDGMYGVVRFAEAARQYGLPTIFGAELGLDGTVARTRTEAAIALRSGVPDPPGRHLLVLARDPAGYASLCRCISAAHRRGGTKGRPTYEFDELAEHADGHWLVLTGCRKGPVRTALEGAGFGMFALDPARRALAGLVDAFGRDNVAVELGYALDPLADERYESLATLADEAGLPVVATTGAHYHAPARRPLATATAAVRARSSLDDLDGWLPAWADAHLRSGSELAARFARWPTAVENAARLGSELAFKIELIAPKLPPFPVPPGHTEDSYLRELTYAGAAERFAGKAHEQRAYAQLEHELAIIEKLTFPGYFLVVWDIARFCREQGILCQGRGSAANSAVCYALGVTAVDAVERELLFERFLAPEREEAPDIDIDIESGRREEVIQYVYERHDRDHAAQVANVITYRPRSAIRDVARALGHSPGQQDAWSKYVDRTRHWPSSESPENQAQSEPLHQMGGKVGGDPPRDERSREEPAGRDAARAKLGVDRRIGPEGRDGDQPPADVTALALELENAPRHLGIHSGGMVICDRPIVEVCPVEWGRMANRSVLQWDKDDCEAVGLVKFDLLGLGMLSAIRVCFELIESWHGDRYDLDAIPKEQECVYDMLCAADAVGVFQVESRAQLATLPRLRPRTLYDLAIEVALIRPGPIQGDAVHPYIRRRHGDEPITYPHPKLEPALRRTLGIPLFQEQLMQIAVAAADFTPAEADRLRRAMASKRAVERIDSLRDRLYEGMAANGITGAVADDIYARIEAFASYGFAESHSISFALLVYASSWLKRHYPAAFCAALLASQPMGFYSPQSLVHDAKRHGIEVRRADINVSAAQAVLDAGAGPSQCPCRDVPQPAVRLGLSGVRGIGSDLAEQIVADRDASGPFGSMSELARRVGLSTEQVEALATAGAFECFGADRRSALWGAGAAASARPGQLAVPAATGTPVLPAMSAPEQLIADMWATSITPDLYPTALIRDRLDALDVITATGLRPLADRTRVTVGGVVTHRQRPPTAGGVTFVNLEDETGMVNVICPAAVWARNARVAREAGGLLVRGMLERNGDVINILAERIERLPLGLRTRSRDFR